MLRYGGYTWLLDVRDSPIQARIGPGCCTPEEVHWQVDLHYIAGGPAWRRVKSWLRPTLRFCVYGFRPRTSRWEDLEGQGFDSDSDDCEGTGGTLFIETTHLNSPEWRFGAHRLQFIRRQGFWFTTELIAAPEEAPICGSGIAAEDQGLVNAATTVQAHSQGGSKHSYLDSSGQDITSGDADAQTMYIIEDLPFGLVEVAAPANAPHPERYGRARARALTGLDRVAEAEVGPRLAPDGKEWRRVGGGDWRVRLHHGDRWTHFSL